MSKLHLFLTLYCSMIPRKVMRSLSLYHLGTSNTAFNSLRPSWQVVTGYQHNFSFELFIIYSNLMTQKAGFPKPRHIVGVLRGVLGWGKREENPILFNISLLCSCQSTYKFSFICYFLERASTFQPWQFIVLFQEFLSGQLHPHLPREG